MKKNILLGAVTALLLIAGCSKTATDYTTGFVGTYKGSTTYNQFNTIVVSKVDNSTVSMSFQRDTSNVQFTYSTVQKAAVSTANNQNTIVVNENDPVYFTLTIDTVCAISANGTLVGSTLTFTGTATNSQNSLEVIPFAFTGTKQ